MPCAFDADACLGWCGDIFGGLGPAGAVKSGAALATAFHRFNGGDNTSVLPAEGAWVARTIRQNYDDIMCISGPSTGRREPQDGVDHTWPAAAKLSLGLKLQATTDSLASY